MKRTVLAALLLLALSHAYAGSPTHQYTAFTYQGSLTASGHPANGNFDMTFKLFDSETGVNQVGATITMSQFPVVNGAFTTDLDFPGAFTGNQLWLEVTIGTQTLSPRQPVNSVPVAEFALSGNMGPAGPPGPRGYTSLIGLTPELPGTNCTVGGTKITSGADVNGNGILDPGEVTATSYLCNIAAPTLPPQCFGALVWGNPAIDYTFADPQPGASSGLNTGALVTLAAHPLDPNSCGTLALTPYAYGWSLFSVPEASKASLSNATYSNPAFIPDVPGTYVLEVTVKDAIGNQTPAAYLSMTTSSCGANPITVNVSNAGINSEGAFALTATATSDDNNPVQCPIRFSPSFTYSWSALNVPLPSTWQFSGATLPSTQFLPSALGSYDIGVSVRGSSGQSGSGSIALLVQPLATTTTVTSDINPSTSGQSVTFTATVAPAYATFGQPAGTATFQDGNTFISNCSNSSVIAGIATCTTASLTVGPHTIMATYSGAADFNPSSGTLSQTVN